MIVGIDNGLNGGVVALSPLPGLPPIAKHILPIREAWYAPRKTTKGKWVKEIDTRKFIDLLDLIGGNREETTVIFEECPFHADQAITMRSMAMSAGKIIAVLEAKAYKVIRVLSYDWHPVILGKVPQGQTKAFAKAKADELWPNESWLVSDAHRTPHDGMIDAALIAEYGRRLTYKTFPTPSLSFLERANAPF